MLADALEHLVRGIVDHPDDVRVDARTLRRGDLLEVRVHPDDLGRVIGRGGRTARALRTVVGAQPTEQVLALLKVTGDWQKFKGLPGAEGTLRTKAAPADVKAAVDAVAADAEKAKAKASEKKAAAAEAPAADEAPAEDEQA
jgi:small subunit ribosomal protein S16